MSTLSSFFFRYIKSLFTKENKNQLFQVEGLTLFQRSEIHWWQNKFLAHPPHVRSEETDTKLKTCLIHNHTITEKIYKVKIPISAHLTLRQLVWKHTPFTLWAVVKLYEPNQKRTTFTLKAVCAFWNEFIAETICSFYFGSKCSPFPGWGLNSKCLLRSWRFPCKLQVTAATCYQPN